MNIRAVVPAGVSFAKYVCCSSVFRRLLFIMKVHCGIGGSEKTWTCLSLAQQGFQKFDSSKQAEQAQAQVSDCEATSDNQANRSPSKSPLVGAFDEALAELDCEDTQRYVFAINGQNVLR